MILIPTCACPFAISCNTRLTHCRSLITWARKYHEQNPRNYMVSTNLAVVEDDLILGPTLAMANAAAVPAIARAGELLRVLALAPIPAVRQKRSHELSTSCQAVSKLGTRANDEVMVMFVMALLSFADSTPRA